MPLETSTFISGLVGSNPVSADKVQFGDDHIRLIKQALNNTFPNASQKFYFPTVKGIVTGNLALDVTYDNALVRANCTAGQVIITLPSAVDIWEGWSVKILKTDTTLNFIKIAASAGNLIRGVDNYYIGEQYEIIEAIYAGSSGWIIVGDQSDLGHIKIWPLPTFPAKYIEPNGALLSRTTYSDLNALYSAQSYPYGAGDGISTFKIPDYRGRFLRHVSGASSNDPDKLTRTDRGDTQSGNIVGTLQAEDFKSHTHTQQGTFNTTNSGTHTHGLDRGGSTIQNVRTDSSANVASATAGVSDAGGNHDHNVTISGQTAAKGGAIGAETRPININVYYMLKAWR